MSKNHDIFDDLIKSQLEGFEANVSMDDWSSIESKLDAIDTKKKRPLWWAAAIGLLLFITGTIFWLNQSSDIAPVVESIVTPEIEEGPTTKESVVVKKYIPTEARSGKTANEPNTHEKVTTTTAEEKSGNETNTLLLNSSDIDTKKEIKTLPQSTTEVNKLPTRIVDIKPGGGSIKGGIKKPGFSTSLTVRTNNDLAPKRDSDNTNLNESETTLSLKDILPNISRWEVGISFTPTWASKVIAPNGRNAWKINPYFDAISKEMEQGGVSYQLEARVNRYISNNVYLGLGLNYNQVQESVDYNYLVDYYLYFDVERKEVRPEFLDPRAHTEVNYSGRNTYHYFEVPLRLGANYPIQNRKFNVRIEGGFKYIRLVQMNGKRADATYMDELIDLESAMGTYSRNNLGLNINAGLTWQLSDKIDIGGMPFFNYSLTSIRNRDEGITEKPYNFGLNIGLQYNILTK